MRKLCTTTRRVWKQQWLGAPTPGFEACPCLLSLYNWGLLWHSWFHHSLASNLTLHSQTSQKPTIPRRGLLAPNLWWDISTNTRRGLWGWRRPPDCGPRWPSFGPKNLYWTAVSTCAYMKYLGWKLHPTSYPHSPIKEYLHPQPHSLSRSTSDPIPITWPKRDAPKPWANGTWYPKDIPDSLDVPEEVISDLDTWAQDVLNYEW